MIQYMKQVIIVINLLLLRLALTAAGFIAVSCGTDCHAPYPDTPSLKVICTGYDGDEAEGTKSRFSDSQLALHNYNVWVYDSGGRLANVQSRGFRTLFDADEDVDCGDLFPKLDAMYDVFVLANTGSAWERRVPLTAEAAEECVCNFGDYSSFADDGFPMAGRIRVCPALMDRITVPVRCLVARYDLTFVNDVQTDYEFRLKRVSSMNCARKVRPFAVESGVSSASDVFGGGDFFVEGSDDLIGRTGTLYLLENVQGEVFENGLLRTESTIAQGMGGLASYLEFEGEYRKKDDTGYHSVTCRYYFGQGKEAYVRGNCRTVLTLRLTNGILGNDEWTVTPQDRFNDGRVRFTPASAALEGGGAAYPVTVSTYGTGGVANPYVRYTLSYNAADFRSAGLDMEYMASGSSSWTSYLGQTITGPCSLRLRSTFSGLGDKTATVSAKSADTYLTELSEEPLRISVSGYPYPVSLKPLTTDFTNMEERHFLEYIVTYSDGSTRLLTGAGDALTLSKQSGGGRIIKASNGYYSAPSGSEYCYRCAVRASFTDSSYGKAATVTDESIFSVWALDADSRNTCFNCFQDRNGSMSTDNHTDYYVRSGDISTGGTLFNLTGATLCLTDGTVTKVMDVNPEGCSWTLKITGQSSHGIFSVSGGNSLRIVRSGNITGANAKCAVSIRCGYMDTDGNKSASSVFNVTVL